MQFKNEALKKEYEMYLDTCDNRWPISSREYYIETSYGKTFVRESGEGEPLILLPGFQVSSLSYASMVEELSCHFHVFAIDIVGDFGKSYKEKELGTSEDFVLWQKELYEALPLSSEFSVMGTSLGARLGALYCVAFPEQVSNLIMLSPAGVVANMNKSTVITGLLSNIFPFAAKRIFRNTFKNTYAFHNQAEQVLDEEVFGPMKIIKRCFKSSLPLVPKQLSEEEISSIKANILYFVGEDETLYDAKEGKAYFDSHVKNGESFLVPQAGHDLIMLELDLIVEKVISFLEYR